MFLFLLCEVDFNEYGFDEKRNEEWNADNKSETQYATRILIALIVLAPFYGGCRLIDYVKEYAKTAYKWIADKWPTILLVLLGLVIGFIIIKPLLYAAIWLGVFGICFWLFRDQLITVHVEERIVIL